MDIGNPSFCVLNTFNAGGVGMEIMTSNITAAGFKAGYGRYFDGRTAIPATNQAASAPVNRVA